MAVSVKELGLDRLSVEDKLALIGELWDDLSRRVDAVPVAEAQMEEVRKRLKEDDENPDDVVTWEETRAEARDILRS